MPLDAGVDFDDLIEQPGVTDRSLRRARSRQVVASVRDPGDPARTFDGVAFAGHHRDGLELAFGGTTSLNVALARRRGRSASLSSSAMRRRAASSSLFSIVGVPARRPVSTR